MNVIAALFFPYSPYKQFFPHVSTKKNLIISSEIIFGKSKYVEGFTGFSYQPQEIFAMKNVNNNRT